MAKVLISYDLNNPGRDYQRITERIKQIGSAGWAKPLESLWIVLTSWTPYQIVQDLENYCDASSRILAVDVTGSPMAWSGVPDNVSDWLKAN